MRIRNTGTEAIEASFFVKKRIDRGSVIAHMPFFRGCNILIFLKPADQDCVFVVLILCFDYTWITTRKRIRTIGCLNFFKFFSFLCF